MKQKVSVGTKRYKTWQKFWTTGELMVKHNGLLEKTDFTKYRTLQMQQKLGRQSYQGRAIKHQKDVFPGAERFSPVFLVWTFAWNILYR